MQKEITSFIEEIDGRLVVSHRIIAIQTQVSEENVSRLIRKHKDKLERFGAIGFEIQSPKDGHFNPKPEKTYFLNEQQATLLLTFMRNNEIVIEFKVRLVEDFFKMREALKSKKVVVQNNNPMETRVQLIEHSGRLFEVFEKVFHKIGITEKTELAITSNRAVKNETTIDFIALSGKNGLEVEEKFFTVTELCELIRKSDDFSDEVKKLVSTKDGSKAQPRNLNKVLEENGFQFKEENYWKATKTGENFSKFVQNKSTTSTKNVFHLNWRFEVLEEIF